MNPKEGYLSKQGVNALRSSFAKDIFAQDLHFIYEKQTGQRNELKQYSQEMIADIIAKINSGIYDNPTVENLLLTLAERLKNTNGKKQYGYLRVDIKKIVNGILIPVYNVEKYLEQCLESLINQSLEDITIICINDGSTDNSGKILKDYSSKDNRIKVIEQSNKGYGAALNTGLSIATSKYIGIVEPDDFIDPITFESLYELAEKGGFPDIVKFAYNDYFENEDNTHSIFPSESSQIESHYYSFRISEYPNILIYHSSIWSGIYSLEFIKENKISFVEAPGAGWTDNPFFYFFNVSCQKYYLE